MTAHPTPSTPAHPQAALPATLEAAHAEIERLILLVGDSAPGRAWCAELAHELAQHLHTRNPADVRPADAAAVREWADALSWFASRVHGGHRSIYAQQEFDRRFGAVVFRTPSAPSARAQQVPEGGDER